MYNVIVWVFHLFFNILYTILVTPFSSNLFIVGPAPFLPQVCLNFNNRVLGSGAFLHIHLAVHILAYFYYVTFYMNSRIIWFFMNNSWK